MNDAARPAPSPDRLVQGLVDLLDVEEIDTDLYRGARRPGGQGRVFGGQVIAQALQAAQRSTEAPRMAHSLHAHFLRPGSANAPVTYKVTSLGEGRSFARRRVDAFQHDDHVLTMTVSMQLEEEGLHHSAPPPDYGDRQSAERALNEWRERNDMDSMPIIGKLGLRPVEVIPLAADSLFGNTSRAPHSAVWMRSRDPRPTDPGTSRAQLAYASDMLFLRNALLPHGVRPGDSGMQLASLDHAMWFHQTPDFRQWHLFATDSPWAGKARGLSRGHFFAEDGTLVATVVQENLMRIVGGETRRRLEAETEASASSAG